MADSLFDQIRLHFSTVAFNEHKHKPRPDARTPATHKQIKDFEQYFKVRLPHFVKKLYLDIHNGGFGPGTGLFCLTDKPSESEAAKVCRIWENCTDPITVSWPTDLIPLAHLGCNMHWCVSTADHSYGQIILFEPNSGDDDDSDFFFIFCESAEQWFEIWCRAGNDIHNLYIEALDHPYRP